MAKISKARRLEILEKFPEFKKQITDLKETIDVMFMEFDETMDKLNDLEESIEDVEQKKLEMNI